MKLLYTPILIIIFFITNLNAQISGNWQQNFEGMPINQSPLETGYLLAALVFYLHHMVYYIAPMLMD